MVEFKDKYEGVREHIRTGDIFAFGGKGDISNIIKAFTRSSVSHVGVALVTPADDNGNARRIQIIESTSLNGFSGVSMTPVSARLLDYNGEVWWLPLGGRARNKVDTKHQEFLSFLLAQLGKPYDTMGAIGAGFDLLDKLGAANKENFATFFCSEFASAALESVRAFGEDVEINSSEVTPIDLCMFQIYSEGPPTLLRGDETAKINGYNSLPVPKRWGF